MSLRRPTLAELRERVTQDVATRLGTGPLLRRSMLGILAEAEAGAVHGAYGHLEWVARQLFPTVADAEQLVVWATIFGVDRRPATYSTGPVTFTGTDGAQVPAGTRLSSAGGVIFETEALVTIASGTASASVSAVEAGGTGELASGSTLTLVSPVSGVQAAATVGTGGIGGGEDLETDESLRERLLARMRTPPRGGAAADYVAWCLEVPGVTRAWALPEHLGVGTVGVIFTRDGDSDGPVPSSGEVAEVQAYIDERRPVTADVTVFAPSITSIAVTLSITPDTATLRAAVEASLRDTIERNSEPGGTIYLSHLREAVSTTPGETDHEITVPAADVVLGASALATLGVVTWA